MADIVTAEDVLGGKARIEGRRVSVYQIGEMCTVGGDTPEEIADHTEAARKPTASAVGR